MQNDLGEKEESFDDADKEQRILAKSIVNKHFKRIRSAVKKNKFLNTKALYQKLFSAKSWPDGMEDICDETIEKLQANILSYEDATPYLYLQDQLEGKKSNTLIRHLFIDEAQDYSPFQFEFLKQLFPHCKMTILGDVNQAIYAHTMDAPSLLNMEPEGTEKIVLRRSYRSTKQIVDFTSGLIAGGDMIEPFNREGEKPVLTEVESHDDLHVKVEECVRLLKEKGHETIAIICKTMKESEAAYEVLKKELPVRLMDKNANSYEKGIIILPAYLAKGIEFDAVIIYNASNEQYGREYERKLFYTACTRAMHELHLFSKGKRTYLIDQVSEDAYSKE